MFLIFPKNEVRFFLTELNLLDEGELSVVGESGEISCVSLTELVVSAFLRNVVGVVGVGVGSATFLLMTTGASPARVSGAMADGSKVF